MFRGDLGENCDFQNRKLNSHGSNHFVEEVRKWFLENPAFGANRSIREMLLYEGGVRIETTIDLGLQAAAEKAVETEVKVAKANAEVLSEKAASGAFVQPYGCAHMMCIYHVLSCAISGQTWAHCGDASEHS